MGKWMLMSDITVIQCDIKQKQESRDRMLKAAGSMCVLAACIGFVRELLRTGSLHKEYLEALIELTELLSAEIRYERLPIQEALQQIQKKIRPEIAVVLRQMIDQMKDGTGTPFSEIWEQAFRKGGNELFLTAEEMEEVCRVGKHLGFLDQRQQEEHLQGCRERLQRLLRLRQKELEEKKHMYRCLGVAAGIFVILILV